LFLANIKGRPAFFFLVGLCDTLREVNSFVQLFQNIRPAPPASRQPDFPAGGRLTDQSSHHVLRGVISIFQKRLSPSGSPIHAKIIYDPLPCHVLAVV
jgi:hypothetical protein